MNKMRHVLVVLAFCLSIIVMAIICSVIPAFAANNNVKSGFISYQASVTKYNADVYYDESINANELATAKIELVQTQFNPPNANYKLKSDLTIMLMKPDGNTQDITWSRTFEKTDDMSGTLFSYGDGIDIDGTYTVSVSGTMTVGSTKKTISSSFNFVVDTTPPSGALIGVSNFGYTNGSVRFTWGENNCRAILDGKSYSNGDVIDTEGRHFIILTDQNDNSSCYEFTIDREKPVAFVAGVNANGYSNDYVTVACSKYGVKATLNGNAYTLGSKITAEGSYEVEITDRAGNRSEVYSFTIDKTKPIANLSGVNDKGFSNAFVTVDCNESGVTATLNGEAYTLGSKITQEGYYEVYLTDLAYNRSDTYSFTIDTSGPVIDSYNTHVNTSFTLSAQDNYTSVAYWECRLNNGNVQRYNGQTVTVGGGGDSNGTWHVDAYDELGNKSSATVYHAFRSTFGNMEEVYNSYSVASYYTVTLAQRNYAQCYGTYSFAEYSHAIDFAVSKEWECRVIPLGDGTSWNYVTLGNENARQIYTNYDELADVISVYAERNVSARQIVPKNGTTLKNPTDEDGITRADALTRQIKELPTVLSGYGGLKFMLAPATAALKAPQQIVEGNTVSATMQYVSDGISLRKGPVMALNYGVDLDAVTGTQEQGWYLISESDVCGNAESYLIYIDRQQPLLQANIVLGDGTKKTVSYSADYVEGNASTMRYVSFSVSSLKDNVDDYAMFSIEGRGINVRFLEGDEIPVLSYENGYYGAYTITVYDRSHNELQFEVFIAGATPSLSHSSLDGESLCRFTVQLNDGNNALTDIKLFKQLYDGSEERISVDSFGTAVSAQNLEYRIDVGGKYVFEFTDLYGRTVRSEPLFYRKGLPTASFRGVREGGITNSDVSVTYSVDVTAELYTLENGDWRYAQGYSIKQNVTENVLSITASAEATAVYKLVLFVTSDKNLFSEYTFEIDGVPPQVQVYTVDGDVVASESVTSKNFYITWQESGYAAFYKRQGAFGETRYNRETVITSAGTYLFTFTDSAKNETVITITLDNTVTYTLEGTYTQYGSGYLTRNSFLLTILEPCKVFRVETNNGLAVVNGQRIDVDGTYVVYVCDMFDNELNLTLIVDKLPPVPIIQTESGKQLHDGARTSEAFQVHCDENGVSITYALKNGVYAVYEGQLLNEATVYSFKLTDRGGNVATVSITLEREVQYRIEGKYIVQGGVYRFGQWALVVAEEELLSFTIVDENGNYFDTSSRLTVEGRYFVKLVDVALNEVELELEIDKTGAEVIILTESGVQLAKGGTTREAFSVGTEEDNVTIKYRLNGDSEVIYEGGQLDDEGYYLFTVSDVLGNTYEFAVTITRKILIQINGTYVVDGLGRYVSRTWLSVTAQKELKEFYVQNEREEKLIATNRITVEGTYYLYAQDEYGNEVTIFLVIDKTPPTVKLDGVIAGGATRSNVKVSVDDFVEAYYRFNGGNELALLADYSFSDEGHYTLTSRDLIGNSVSVSFDIDKHVDMKSEQAVFDGQIFASPVSFRFNESVTVTLYHDAEESAYAGGLIKEPGLYELKVIDSVGNEQAYRWLIIPAKARGYVIPVSEDWRLAILKDNETYIPEESAGKLNFVDGGKYVISTDLWSVEFEIDDVTPTVNIENTKKSIKVSSPNKSGVRYELYRNGKKVSFNFTKENVAEITAKGDYRLVCSDDVGNVSEYKFTLNYMSTTTLVLIIVVSAVAVTLLIILLVSAFRKRKF